MGKGETDGKTTIPAVFMEFRFRSGDYSISPLDWSLLTLIL
jgi:hypothetical protein